MRNFLFCYWRSFIILGIICYLSFASPATFSGIPSFENEDKLVHLFMYAGFTTILIFDFRQFSRKRNTNITDFTFWCLIFPIFIGGAIEIIQPAYFAPRTGSWFDFAFDIAGVLIGWAFMHYFKNQINKLFVRKHD